MTVVVGFNWPLAHDHSVSVIIDGELVFASEEERWTRHKHSPGEPPVNALRQAFLFLRRKYGIKPKDIDAYAVNFDPKLMAYTIRFRLTANTFVRLINRIRFNVPSDLAGIGPAALGLGFTILRGDYLDLARRFVRSVAHSIGEDVPDNIKIIPVPHHLTHAASAYYFSGFNNATVLTVDGSGEFEATVVWRVRDGEFEKIASIPAAYGSLGFYMRRLV